MVFRRDNSELSRTVFSYTMFVSGRERVRRHTDVFDRVLISRLIRNLVCNDIF